MQRGSSLLSVLIICLFASLPAFKAFSGTDMSKWDFTSYQVNLLEHHGGSGDIQSDQNGWIHLGANHLEGGDIKYEVPVGRLSQADILEVWIDGYSTSNDLTVGPTIFIGSGKNRSEQITRITGDAWRPFVFHFAADAIYGDVTDPSNRNANWRTRYPSSKYEVRRLDKSPQEILENGRLPIRISMTGTEDFIVKRVEVLVYRAQQGPGATDFLCILNLDPYTVRRGEMLNMRLNKALPSAQVDFYLVDPLGREHPFTPRILNNEQDRLGLYVDDDLFARSGEYQVKVIDRSSEREYVDLKRFEYVHPSAKIVPKPTPPILSPAEECEPTGLPPIPQAPPAYVAPGYGPLVSPQLNYAAPYGPPNYVAPVAPVAPPTYAPSSYVAPARGYTIQIGAFRTQAGAVAVRERLRRNGYDAYIAEAAEGANRIFRVRVGRYPDKSLALRDANRLRQSGFDTWITDLS